MFRVYGVRSISVVVAHKIGSQISTEPSWFCDSAGRVILLRSRDEFELLVQLQEQIICRRLIASRALVYSISERIYSYVILQPESDTVLCWVYL